MIAGLERQLHILIIIGIVVVVRDVRFVVHYEKFHERYVHGARMMLVVFEKQRQLQCLVTFRERQGIER